MIETLLKDNRHKIVLICSISVLAGLANIWLLALVSASARQGSNGTRQLIAYIAALVLMIGLALLSQVLLSKLSARTFFRLRHQLVSDIALLNTRQIERVGSHTLYSALTRDVSAMHDLIIVLPNYVFNLTVILACLGYLGLTSWKLLLVLVACLAVALYVSKVVIVNRADRQIQLRRNIEDALFKCYQAVIEGNRELKLHRQRKEQLLQQELRGHAERYRDATMRAELLWNLSNTWNNGVIFMGIGALLFLAASLNVSPGVEVTSFIIVILYMVGPLTVLMNSFRAVYNAKASVKRLGELQIGQQAIVNVVPPVQSTFRSLSLRDVIFKYDAGEEGQEQFQIGPLNLEFRRGEIVYFVGGNGSGKSTAAKVLTGLYPRHSGSILVNGAGVDDACLQQHFSAIFQDFHLFERVVGKSAGDIDAELVSRMIARLRLDGKTKFGNECLTTTALSYGQRKRLALLVAYFEGSELYLFDEWAADQDLEFREFFYREFLPELKREGKTCIVITHDERYFHLADLVVKFERGSIVSATQHSQRPVQIAFESERAPVPAVRVESSVIGNTVPVSLDRQDGR